MTLGRKTLALFLVLGLAICAGSYVALRIAVVPTFEEFERTASAEALSRATQLLDSKLEALSIINIEYSAWDDTAQFISDQSQDFRDENLSPGYWHSIDINFLAVFGNDGQLVYGWLLHPEDGRELDIANDLLEPLGPGHVLLAHDKPSSRISGLLRTRTGVLAITSQPVTNTEQTGDIAGTFMIGQFLTTKLIDELGKQATTEMTLHQLGQTGLPGHIISAFRNLEEPDADTTIVTFGENVHAMKVLRDVHDESAAVLEIRQPRRISSIGVSTIRTAMMFLAVGSIGFLLAALFFTQRLIVAPIGDLTRKILAIQRTGNLEMEIGDTRADEVGMLAGQFAELTSGLAKARKDLENARDEALSMSKAKSEFLARMSHEIRTPMNGVLGMTELLQSTPLNEKQQRFARTIYSSAESLLHIINDILDISKIEAGKLELDIAPFNLRHLVEECLDLLADSAHRKDLELVGSIPMDTHTFVEGDALRLRQILINLLSNAVKFTERGEIIVRIHEVDHDGDEVTYRFEVQDTGVGIDAKNLERVFEPFAQEDGSTTRRYGGTGLGLSICRQLLEIMGGEIGAESVPGRGCRFWFTLQLRKDEAVADSLSAELLEGKRVLVVDDNATNREALEQQLENWSMTVEMAASGAEALGILASAARRDIRFDLVLLDMNMPEMDGIELAAAIRANEAIGPLPLIMLSSVSSGDAGEDRDLGGVDAWLTKPVRQTRLYDALVSHLSRSRAAEQFAPRDGSPTKAINDNANRTLSILLAEDNEVNQKVALGMLKQLGHEIMVVADGRAAVEARKSRDFDLILMDCQMPVLDGFEATQEIRAWEESSGKKPMTIVAVTANALSGDRERCLAAGMDDYLSKPFSVHKLGAALAANSRDLAEESRGHILIVDDNAINQQVTTAMARELGYTTEVVADGEQALRALSLTSFDLILMDCHMPVLDGYDATREIRRREEASQDERHVPIVAVTADLMQSNRERCLECGMDDYVTKPFTEEQLRLVIARWVGDGDDEAGDAVAIDTDGFSALTETSALASIDRMALEEIYKLDSSPGKNTVREIVVSYCALSTKLLLQLRAAIAERDAGQVELLAHSLKGSSGQIGAVLLATLCEQILTAARNDNLDDALPLCERAAVEHSAVIIALDKELQRIAA